MCNKWQASLPVLLIWHGFCVMTCGRIIPRCCRTSHDYINIPVNDLLIFISKHFKMPNTAMMQLYPGVIFWCDAYTPEDETSKHCLFLCYEINYFDVINQWLGLYDSISCSSSITNSPVMIYFIYLLVTMLTRLQNIILISFKKKKNPICKLNLVLN